MKAPIISIFLILLAFSCKKNDPLDSPKTRLKSFTFHHTSAPGKKDSTTVQYSGGKVSHIKIIDFNKFKISSINEYALFYEDEKLVSCTHTFEIEDYYPKGIQVKSDENDQLTMISSGTGGSDFVLYYNYINKTRIKTVSRDKPGSILEYYEFDSSDNLILVKSSKNTPSKKYEYNEVMNPFNDFNLPIKPFLSFVSGPYQISYLFSTASKNAPVSFSSSPFTTVSAITQRLNTKGQLIETSMPTNSTNKVVYSFYYE